MVSVNKHTLRVTSFQMTRSVAIVILLGTSTLHFPINSRPIRKFTSELFTYESVSSFTFFHCKDFSRGCQV